MSSANRTIRGRVLAGSLWLIILRSISRVIGFTSTILLARLLVPEDFGLMAMAAVSMAFLEAFTTLNLGTVLIRNALSSRADYDTAWTLQILRGTLIAVVVLVGAPAIAGYFEEPRMIQILPFVAAASFINGFHNIGMVDLEKQFRFQSIVIKESLTRVTMVLLQVTLALVWRNYWALIAGIVCQSVVAVSLSYSFSPYRPRLSLARFAEIFGFGKWLTLSSITLFLMEQADSLIIGRMLTPEILGLYVIGRNFITMPVNELCGPVARVMFPAYAQIAHDPAALYRAMLMMLAAMVAVVAPACAGLALISEPFVLVVLGAKWLPAADIMTILAIGAIISTASGVFSQILIVIGRPQLCVYTLAASLLVYVPALIVGVGMAEAPGAAAARATIESLGFIAFFWITSRVMALRVRDVVAVVWRSLVAVAVMIGVVVWLRSTGGLFGAEGGLVLLLAQLVLAGAVSYGVVLLGLWLAQGRPVGAEEHVWEMMTRLAGHRRLAFLKRRLGSQQS